MAGQGVWLACPTSLARADRTAPAAPPCLAAPCLARRAVRLGARPTLARARPSVLLGRGAYCPACAMVRVAPAAPAASRQRPLWCAVRAARRGQIKLKKLTLSKEGTRKDINQK